MGKSVADFLKTANEEEIISRREIFKKATRGVGLEMLEIPEWAKTLFGKYLNLELNSDKLLKKMSEISVKEKSFYVGVICGRIEEIADGQITTGHYDESKLLKIKEIPSLAKEHDFTFAFCTFLDDFKRAYDKYGLIEEEPPETDYITKRDYCVLAASAHKLANDNNIPTPEWIHDTKYILDIPYYAFSSKEAQQYLRETSPIEFKIRNIFTTDNAIERA